MTKKFTREEFMESNLNELQKILGNHWGDEEIEALWTGSDSRGEDLVRGYEMEPLDVAIVLARERVGDSFDSVLLHQADSDVDGEDNEIAVFHYDDNGLHDFFVDIYYPDFTHSVYE